jgi:hypothetical protein
MQRYTVELTRDDGFFYVVLLQNGVPIRSDHGQSYDLEYWARCIIDSVSEAGPQQE